MAALEIAKTLGYSNTLCICNTPESSLVRASDITIFTHAGREIGVASTKAFTTQLVTLLMIAICLRRRRIGDGRRIDATEAELVQELRTLPQKIEDVLQLENDIIAMSKHFADKQNALFLGRGAHFPIAMEGALKLKEISYIEVRARGGKLYVFADAESGLQSDDETMVLHVAPVNDTIAPILYVVPLQLLSYHVALLKGTDIDKPRNLAKSVTVE